MTTVTLPNSTTTTEYYSGSGVTLVNTGVQGAAYSHTTGHLNFGFYITGNSDTLINKGAVYGERIGIYFKGTGDSLINNAGKKIVSTLQDRAGVYFYYSGSVTNYGVISGFTNATPPTDRSNAIELGDGGVVTNSGTLSNGGVRVLLETGTITNTGVILGNAAMGAVYMGAGGTVTNLGGGVISGNGATEAYNSAAPYGVWINGGAGTVTNAGTIIGGGANGTTGYAIRLATGFQNLLIADPGAVFDGAVNGGTAADATLELASGTSKGTLSGFGSQFTNFGTLDFAHSSTWLISANTNISSAIIDGFVQGDTIDVTGFTAVNVGAVGGGTSVTLTNSGGTHEVLHFNVSPGNMTIASGAGISGTDLTTICFCVGTLIDTPDGEVQVQKLHPGDIVSTAHNGPRKVTWVGVGKVLATRGKRSAGTPVIVLKGALADNVPHEDLRVTKAHALYIDGVLIPVEFLVNHKTILWDDRAQEVEIYHVELESHDVLIANGALAESFRDDGNRWLFQNARSGWDLPPQEPCAPVLTGGPVVDAAWRRLLNRAGPRDLPPLTDDPDLHLIIDGVRVDARERKGSEHVFHLPFGPTSVIIASRTGVPCELGIARDPRPLGVALQRVTIRQGSKLMLFDADDERLTAGFHNYEPSDRLRWTDGCAELPIEMFARLTSGAEVMLHLGGATMYPDSSEHAGQVAA
jgi:hypothetical protein